MKKQKTVVCLLQCHLSVTVLLVCYGEELGRENKKQTAESKAVLVDKAENEVK